MPDTKPAAPPAIQIEDAVLLESEVSRILRAVEEADGALQTARAEVIDGRKLLEIEQDYPNKPYPGASTATVPVAADTKAQIRARIVEALSSGDVFSQFAPESLDDREDAEAVERMVQACCEGWLDFRRKVLMPLVDTCLRDESSFAYVGWEKRTVRKKRWQWVREFDPYGNGEWLTEQKMAEAGIPTASHPSGAVGWGQLPADGTPAFFVPEGEIPPGAAGVREERQEPVESVEVEYDGPKVSTLRFEELGWHPTNQVDLGSAPTVYYYLNLSGKSVRQFVGSGYFDKTAVFERKEGDPPLAEHPGDEVYPVRSNAGSTDNTASQPFDSRNYNLIEAHTPVVLREGEEPLDMVFVIHKATRKCLHAAPSEWWDGGRHFVHMRPFPEPDSMRGDSIPKNEGPYQDPMTRLMRAMVVAAEYGANPSIILASGTTSGKEREKLEKGLAPGEYMSLNADPTKAMMPWRPGLQAGSLVDPLQVVDQFRQRKFGISNTRSGALDPTNRTAQEVRAALLEGSVLLQEAVTNCGAAVADICEILQHELYQNLDKQTVQDLWLLCNPPAELEFPEGQEPAPEDLERLKAMQRVESLRWAGRALAKHYTVKAAGSTEAANPELLAARYTQYIAVMAQLAAAEGALEQGGLNTYELHRRAVNVYRQGDPAKLLGPEKKWAQRRQQGEQMAQMQAQIAQMDAELKKLLEESKVKLNEARAAKTQAEATQIDSATGMQPVDALQKLAQTAQSLQPQAPPQGEPQW